MAKKRGNNEGTISKRSDGRWMGKITLPYGKRKSVYGDTRAEVAAKLTDLQKAVKDGAPVPSDRLTVGAYLDDWMAGHGATVRPTTRARYRSLIDLHLKPGIGARKLAQLQTVHVSRMYGTMSASGLAPRTVRQAHAVLSKAIRDAEERGLVVRNVVKFAVRAKVEDPELDVWNEDEANRFLEHAAADPFAALYRLALSHGLRLGELLGLTWDAVNLEAGYLEVRAQLHARRTKGATTTFELVPPKTKQGRRRIRLASSVIEALRSHRIRQTEARLSLGPAWQNPLGLVFVNSIGGPVDDGNFRSRAFRTAVVRADVKPIRIHDLRHTCATLQLRRGTPLKVVSEMMGHRDPAYTLRLYQHVLPDMQEAAATTADAIFGASA